MQYTPSYVFTQITQDWHQLVHNLILTIWLKMKDNFRDHTSNESITEKHYTSTNSKPCLARPMSILMTEDRRSLTRTPKLFSRFYPLRAEHTLQWVFLSFAWYRQSSVSVVFLVVFFRQRCHVERTCRDYQLKPHGRSTVAFSSKQLDIIKPQPQMLVS